MTRPRTLRCVLLLTAVLVLGSSPAAHGDYVWGTSTAEPATDPAFEGYWQYCFEIGWDVSEFGHAMSNVFMVLGLEDCFCACDEEYFAAEEPAGSSQGVGGCTVYYSCEFNCQGDPHYPGDGPTMKFEPMDDDCELDVTGTMTGCFYSLFPPTGVMLVPDVLCIKFATNVVTGDLVGVLPFCECGATPVETATWGAVKSLYRP